MILVSDWMEAYQPQHSDENGMINERSSHFSASILLYLDVMKTMSFIKESCSTPRRVFQDGLLTCNWMRIGVRRRLCLDVFLKTDLPTGNHSWPYTWLQILGCHWQFRYIVPNLACKHDNSWSEWRLTRRRQPWGFARLSLPPRSF